jgi:hypothetical protein
MTNSENLVSLSIWSRDISMQRRRLQFRHLRFVVHKLLGMFLLLLARLPESIRDAYAAHAHCRCRRCRLRAVYSYDRERKNANAAAARIFFIQISCCVPNQDGSRLPPQNGRTGRPILAAGQNKLVSSRRARGWRPRQRNQD